MFTKRLFPESSLQPDCSFLNLHNKHLLIVISNNNHPEALLHLEKKNTLKMCSALHICKAAPPISVVLFSRMNMGGYNVIDMLCN